MQQVNACYMNSEEINSVFINSPEVLPLYEAARKMLLTFPGVRIEAKKTQISFGTIRKFAWVWLPVRKMKNRPELYIVLSFALEHPVRSPRIVEIVEPYPHHFMHHVIISEAAELDGEVKTWLEMAYSFSMRNR